MLIPGTQYTLLLHKVFMLPGPFLTALPAKPITYPTGFRHINTLVLIPRTSLARIDDPFLDIGR